MPSRYSDFSVPIISNTLVSFDQEWDLSAKNLVGQWSVPFHISVRFLKKLFLLYITLILLCRCQIMGYENELHVYHIVSADSIEQDLLTFCETSTLVSQSSKFQSLHIGVIIIVVWDLGRTKN